MSEPIPKLLETPGIRAQKFSRRHSAFIRGVFKRIIPGRAAAIHTIGHEGVLARAAFPKPEEPAGFGPVSLLLPPPSPIGPFVTPRKMMPPANATAPYPKPAGFKEAPKLPETPRVSAVLPGDHFIPEAREEKAGDVKEIPENLLSKFSHLLKLKIPPVTIMQDDRTDAFLMAKNAAAMTLGQRIYFQQGKFDLKTPEGLGLAGHELTHAAQQADSSPRYGSPSLLEAQALENEKFILRNARSFQEVPPVSAPEAERIAPPPDKSPGATPMFASAVREVSAGASEVPPETKPAPAIPDSEMKRIKEEVYRDIMMRLKIDFERGG